MSKKIKPKETIHVECPCCNKRIIVYKFEDTIEPSKKAIKKEWFEAVKDTQKKLPTGDKKK